MFCVRVFVQGTPSILIDRRTPSLLAISMVRESLSTCAVIVQNNRGLVLEDGGRGACFVLWWKFKKAYAAQGFSRDAQLKLVSVVAAVIKHLYFT